MSWKISQLMSTAASFFDVSISQRKRVSTSSLDTIRNAMLEAIEPLGTNKFAVVQLRVSYANDVQDLWYLRGDLMASLSSGYGEAIAKAKVTQISEMFRGQLPIGLSSRPSPLGD